MTDDRQENIYKKLEASFHIQDHWNFEKSDFEKKRFEQMLKFCNYVPHKTILEIGCAEGHFTKYLTKISQSVTAVDVSSIAIEYARKKVLEATFKVLKLEEIPIPEEKYDLVICSETLYYLLDQKGAIDYLKRLGKNLVTSSFLMTNWGAYISEFYLARLHPLKRKVLYSIPERKLTIVSLWEL
ncbi:MAG TPA: SAM-dependent methyltransferase [Patescibacteria group bacterium]|nr:SAM-dependent methyltransferase [Patescibacteria group bacterium]